MKKLLLLISALFLINPVFAQESLNAMPTDEEIMQTIQKFGFSKEQQEYLFKETKKKLQETYYSPATQKELTDFQSGLTQMPNIEEIQNNAEFNNAFSEQIIKKEEIKPKKREKKYSKHEPLTRRSKQKALENQ